MAITEYKGKEFRLTHTVEEQGPHPTIPYDYYNETFVITFLLAGKGECFVEGNRYPLLEGDLAIFSPDEIHSFQFAQEGRHERVSLYMTNRLLTEFCDYSLPLMGLFRSRPLGAGNRYAAGEYNRAEMMPLLQKLCAVAKEGASKNEPRMHLLILQILFMLYDGARPAAKESEARSTVVAELCAYIKENLAEDLSYAALQKQLFISRYQLSEVFRRQLGMTLTEYIIHKRLMKVISLVRSGEGIEYAAYCAGFHTYSHFYKEFKKRFNASPKVYLLK